MSPSVIHRLSINLMIPVLNDFVIKIETEIQIVIMKRHLTTVLNIKSRTGKRVIERSIDTLNNNAPIEKIITENCANSGHPPK